MSSPSAACGSRSTRSGTPYSRATASGTSTSRLEHSARSFRKGQTVHILSNSHVLARSGRARIGDDILYPGDADGGEAPADLVATLSGFKKFVTGGDFVNGADCAIARPLDARRDELVSAIKGLGVPRGASAPVRGMRIVKVGRTTNKRRPGRSATSTSASRSTTTT